MYRIMYAPNTKKFFHGISTDSNVSEYAGKDFTEFTASGICEDENKKLSEGYQIVIRCSKCKRYFIVSNRQLNWMKQKGFEDTFPKKCKLCKQKKI